MSYPGPILNKTIDITLTNKLLNMTAKDLFPYLENLSQRGREIIRRESNVMSKLITQGDFVKISLMFTYIYYENPNAYAAKINAKIEKHNSGIGCQIYDSLDGAAHAHMSSEALGEWYDQVFARQNSPK